VRTTKAASSSLLWPTAEALPFQAQCTSSRARKLSSQTFSTIGLRVPVCYGQVLRAYIGCAQAAIGLTKFGFRLSRPSVLNSS